MSSVPAAGPLPVFPKQTKIPVFKTTSKKLPDASIPSALSFYYAGISAIWLWYRAPLETLKAAVCCVPFVSPRSAAP